MSDYSRAPCCPRKQEICIDNLFCVASYQILGGLIPVMTEGHPRQEHRYSGVPTGSGTVPASYRYKYQIVLRLCSVLRPCCNRFHYHLIRYQLESWACAGLMSVLYVQVELASTDLRAVAATSAELHDAASSLCGTGSSSFIVLSATVDDAPHATFADASSSEPLSPSVSPLDTTTPCSLSASALSSAS